MTWTQYDGAEPVRPEQPRPTWRPYERAPQGARRIEMKAHGSVTLAMMDRSLGTAIERGFSPESDVEILDDTVIITEPGNRR